MMTKLKEAVEKMVQSELDLASAQYGKRFHSAHEAYAVIKEEEEEAETEFYSARTSLLDFWKSVKKDIDGSMELEETEKIAINAACECIQIAAMARKAQRGYEGDEDKPDD